MENIYEIPIWKKYTLSVEKMWRNENFTQRRSSSQMPDAKRCRLECINKGTKPTVNIILYRRTMVISIWNLSKGYVEIAG